MYKLQATQAAIEKLIINVLIKTHVKQIALANRIEVRGP